MIKKQAQIHLSLSNKKRKEFPWFPSFGFEPYSQKENSEITEISQKRHNTLIWERSFKNSWNAVQVRSNSKSFSHITTDVAAGIWV